MAALTVVEGEILVEPLSCLAAILIGMQADVLVLHRAPQPLDKNVIYPATLAVHTDAATGGLESIEPLAGGILRALVVIGKTALNQKRGLLPEGFTPRGNRKNAVSRSKLHRNAALPVRSRRYSTARSMSVFRTANGETQFVT